MASYHRITGSVLANNRERTVHFIARLPPLDQED